MDPRTAAPAPPVIFQYPCDRCTRPERWVDGRPEPHDCITQEET